MINITHYCPDGVVCSILLKSFIKNLEVKAVGYNSLNDMFDETILTNKKVIITDISLDDYHVNNMFLSNNNILWIDHHQTSLLHKNKSNKKVKIFINEKFCAAGNVLKYFKDKANFSEELKRLAYLTNDYDLWQLKEEESEILNFIFWERKFNSFMSMFEKGYDESKINAFRPAFKNYKDGIITHFERCEKYDVTLNEKKILIIYTDKYINEVTINYKDFDFYFIISNMNKVSIRSAEIDLTNGIKSVESLNGIESTGCHKNAGGINIAKSAFETTEALVDFYYELIEKIVTNSGELK